MISPLNGAGEQRGRTSPDVVVQLATQIKQIIQSAKETGSPSHTVRSPPVEAELRTIQHELRETLIEYRTDHGFVDLDRAKIYAACKVIAEDLLVRLEAISLADVESAQLAFEKAWTKESLVTLTEQLTWIRSEAHSGTTRQSKDASRSLWTTGPEQRDSSGSGPTDDGRAQNAALNSYQDPDPALQAKVRDTLLNVDRTELLQDFFLESLAFSAMHDREEDVSDAHRRTFEWIYAGCDQDGVPASNDKVMVQHNFAPWLMSSEHGRIYWINGKAGSGKSTLMQFIAKHRQTKACLRTWATGLPMIMVSFFFWTGGSTLQRSQTGLLRSLLHQLLTQRRDLIAWVFPELWLACQDTKKRVGMLMSWEQTELLRGLHLTLRRASESSKICLFIDGLDEFEGHEDMVINLVRDIVGISPQVKACVSSRPWPAFERAFQNVPHIMLQELTGVDMEQYITDQLHGDERIRKVAEQATGSELQHFQNDVLERADGVFLWTSLALRSVLQSINSHSTLHSLHQRLLDLPSDLEDLFRYLLIHDRPLENLQEQSHIFQIMRARDQVCDFTGDDSVRSITLYQMLLTFNEDVSNADTAVQQRDLQVGLTMCETFADTLKDRCAGLIVLSGQDKLHGRFRTRVGEGAAQLDASANRRVRYLHRTVKDFLVYSGVWKDVLERSNPTFDAHISLLESHVLRLRFPLHEPEHHRRLDEWWHDDIVLAMTHARFAPATTAQIQVKLLDQLDATLHWYWRKRDRNDPLDTWARHAFGSYEARNKHRTPFHNAFLSLAAKFGLAEYLRLKLASDDKFGYQAGIPLLSHTLEFLISRRHSVYPLTSQTVIRVLLDYGEDPNQGYKTLAAKDETPWLLAIKCVREGKRRGWMRPFDVDQQGTERWAAILKLMLDHGADQSAVILKDAFDPEVTVAGVIDDVGQTYFAGEVWHVKRVLDGLL